MAGWINHLKQVILVVLVCEFLKELLSTSSFRKYVQFAVSLFLFFFLFSSVFRVEFSLPALNIPAFESKSENLLLAEYETRISEEIKEELLKNNLNVPDVTVQLNDRYEINSVTIYSKEDPNKIQAVLKGDFPYEVVDTTEKFLDEQS